jgi:hypothetical protein
MTTDIPLLESLLFTPCLLVGQTSFVESNARVTVSPHQDETVLFFSIDDQSNSQCKLRQALWGTQQGQKMCDLMVFYAKNEERVLCFVELKDNIKDLGHAVKQVTNTYHELKTRLVSKKYIAKAFISAATGHRPFEEQRYLDELEKTFGKNNYEVINSSGSQGNKSDELGNFLRGRTKLGKGKRKRNQ